MNYEIALKKMAKLMKISINLCKFNSSGDLSLSSTKEFNEFEKSQKDVELFGQQCAADPELFDYMIPWMIDIIGTGSCLNDSDLILLLNDPSEFITTKGGGIANAIQQFANQYGFKITDRGAGHDSWHTGIPCNDFESIRLCTLLHQKFGKAINIGAIKVCKKFWGWKLKDLYTWDDVDEYLTKL